MLYVKPALFPPLFVICFVDRYVRFESCCLFDLWQAGYNLRRFVFDVMVIIFNSGERLTFNKEPIPGPSLVPVCRDGKGNYFYEVRSACPGAPDLGKCPRPAGLRNGLYSIEEAFKNVNGILSGNLSCLVSLSYGREGGQKPKL